jgi:16S rRNA (adenine1518-N6/adenine1519-N6)-dimethyltransferase
MSGVRPKKFLGQHFLKDEEIAHRIVEALPVAPMRPVLEIGPGMGVLTKYLMDRTDMDLWVSEIDRESIAWLKSHYPSLAQQILEGDVLEMDCPFPAFDLIGNLPYNISSPIFFRVIDWRDQVNTVVAMVQKEVGERICAGPGTKANGLLSILLQAHYRAEYLFTVPAEVFQPPPKVLSGVIRLSRLEAPRVQSSQVIFTRVVKQAYNMRRKTLRNALKPLFSAHTDQAHPLFDKRAEQLTVEEFDFLTKMLYPEG